MLLRELGAWLLLLLVVFVLGNLWFHVVEGVLGRLKRLLVRGKEPPAWHPLPPEEDEGSDPK